MRGHAVVAARGLADDQLDGFLVLPAEGAGSEHVIGLQDGLQCRRFERADGSVGVRYAAGGLLDLGKDLSGGAGGGFTDSGVTYEGTWCQSFLSAINVATI